MGRQWVMTMRYFIPIYPALIVLAAWGVVELIKRARGAERLGTLKRILAYGTLIIVAGFTLLWAAMYTNVYRNQLTRVQASTWVFENVPGDFMMTIESPDNVMVSMNGGQFQTPSIPPIQIGIPRTADFPEEDIVARVTRFNDALSSSIQTFVAPGTGTVSSIYAPHLSDVNNDPEPETLHFTITRVSDGEVLADTTLSQNLTSETSIVGDPVTITLDEPFEVTEGEQYQFMVELVDGGPVISGGSIFTWEGAWDDPIPVGVCTLPDGLSLADNPPPGLIDDSRECNRRDPWFGYYNGYTQDIVYEDVPEKRDFLLTTLNNSDYIAISSNRFYDTLSRNPIRWPMTNRYYDALFSGELGYDLVATFQETYELGPLRVSDQYLPTYDAPEWLNEFESEEAFSVYDHPVVFIFKKSDDYDPQVAQEILYGVPLMRVNDALVFNNCPEDTDLWYCDPTLVSVAPLSSENAAKAPTMLWLTDDMRETQYSNGTWSERFDSSSPVNTNPVVSVVSWYLVLVVCGLAAFPLLFSLLPGLADRGYAVSKFMGMFLVGWVTWYLASAKIPVWWRGGIIAAMIALFLLGLVLLWKRRSEFVEFIRKRWKLLLVIEVITLAAFLFFLFVRLQNPDLWHDSFGGEKPMNFAYFNAVLRSTIFPPYDPWYSGGFINYYYFGYVIVGVPTLLLQMMPSIAYNLILPTLFATAGIGAFAVAFSVVNALRERLSDGSLRKLGNPYVAGVAALLLAVVLGNLDTPRVALSGVASLGGYTRMENMQEFLAEEYTQANGQPPSDAAMLDIMQQARQNRVGDRLRYEAKTIGDIITALGRGVVALANGNPLYVSADRWFWAPSRVLSEQPVDSGGAITEMPIFTFIYGDMHAHMISMPMQFFIFAFVLNEVLVAGNDKRSNLARWLALAVGAITVGMLRATNTWDWITYMILGTAGVAFAWWLRWSEHKYLLPLNRRSVTDFVLRVGGFVAMTFIAVLPFTTWYTSTYNRVLPWEGNRTPIWAYFDIHGLFLFLVFSLLVWETGRWLRSVKVRSLRGKFELLLALVVIVVALLVAALILSMMSYQVSLIALPLLVWTVILFFRQGQSRSMQFVMALTGLSLGLTLGVEYVVLDGDIGRQNTVFKFYMQVWLMLSVVCGAAFAWLIRSMGQWRGGIRAAWLITLVVLVAVASLFPIMASRGKSVYRMPPAPNEDGTTPDIPFTLDGAAFMQYARRFEGDDDITAVDPELVPFPLEEDYNMIRWLQENIEGTPTIIEGLGDDTQYRWNGRVSIYTGLPAVIGWNFHQRQQRTLEPMGRIVEMRNANVNAFYETHSIGAAWQILQFYGVDYVIVGRLEEAYYNAEGLAKFDQMVEEGLLEVVWQEGETTVYRVNHDAQLAERG
jgi:YYY domain-containing protein